MNVQVVSSQIYYLVDKNVALNVASYKSFGKTAALIVTSL